MARTGRPVNPMTVVNRALNRAAIKRERLLESLDKLCAAQTLRLMKTTINYHPNTHSALAEDIRVEYRTQRLGHALDESDRGLGVRRSMFTNA